MSDVSKANQLIEEARDWLRRGPVAGSGTEIMRGLVDALATRVPVQGEPECECWPTEEKYHFVHFGATEPGSAIEYNPECPEHGEPNDEPCLGCGSAAEDGHDDCTIKFRTFRASVPDAATELALKKAEAFDKAVSLSERRQTLLEEAEAERDAALAAVERVRAIAETWQYGMPEYTSSTYQEGQKDQQRKLVGELLAALDGAPEPEGRWEYRGRLQSCGYVAEGYISAEHAMNGLKVELEDHPYLAMDDTAIVERARVREWLPVEGESKS